MAAVLGRTIGTPLALGGGVGALDGAAGSTPDGDGLPLVAQADPGVRQEHDAAGRHRFDLGPSHEQRRTLDAEQEQYRQAQALGAHIQEQAAAVAHWKRPATDGA